jgi:hypothetical protein
LSIVGQIDWHIFRVSDQIQPAWHWS